jgi:hypothetical protein
MKQVRRSVFETNSSSTHSITITHGRISNNSIRVGSDGYIHTELDDFGWEVCDYRSQAERLSYLVTMLAVKSDVTLWIYDANENRTDKDIVEDIMETREFEKLSDEIGRHARCRGVIIDPSGGYIDHQSHEDYRDFQDFLDYYNTNVVEFVFGHGNAVHTDNDNH